MNEEQIRQLVASIAAQLLQQDSRTDTVPVEVSARHVHLSQADVEALFGAGHTLTPKRDLSQPGQFLAEERVSIVTGKGEFRNVAVLGPARKQTQVELSLTDAKTLGLSAPVRQSGNMAGSPTVCLLAGNNMLQARESAIVAQNHIHMTPADARNFGVSDGQRVRVAMGTARPLTFDDVVIRVNDGFSLAMHIDFDEANACAFQAGQTGRILIGDCEHRPLPISAQVAPVWVEKPLEPAGETEFTGLLTAEEARRLARTCGGTLRLGAGAILTPLARDVLREKKISVLTAKEE